MADTKITIGTIPAGLSGNIMRKRMEDKNTLSHKGSLYVGTGEKETINGVDIYKTQELQAPVTDGKYVLIYRGENILWENSTFISPTIKRSTVSEDTQRTGFSHWDYSNDSLKRVEGTGTRWAYQFQQTEQDSNSRLYSFRFIFNWKEDTEASKICLDFDLMWLPSQTNESEVYSELYSITHQEEEKNVVYNICLVRSVREQVIVGKVEYITVKVLNQSGEEINFTTVVSNFELEAKRIY